MLPPRLCTFHQTCLFYKHCLLLVLSRRCYSEIKFGVECKKKDLTTLSKHCACPWVNIYHILASLFYRMRSDRRDLVDPTNKKKKNYIKEIFALLKPYYANPDISFNSSLRSTPFLNVQSPLKRSQILKSIISEESCIFIYAFLCLLCKEIKYIYTICVCSYCGYHSILSKPLARSLQYVSIIIIQSDL